MVDTKELLSGKGVDQINLFKLIKYLQESKLARKIEGYADYSINASTSNSTESPKSDSTSRPESSNPALHHVSSILSALTHPSKEGRLFFTKDPSTPGSITLKFLLLDPSTSFESIVTEARAVILAGGTMSPMSDYTSHLFPYLSPSSITTLSCGHVIPPSNLVAWNLSTGPTGQDFEFTFKNRSNGAMIDELGLALVNLCSVVPDGIVVFFPSYAFLETFVKRLSFTPQEKAAQAGKSIYQRLEAKKSLFRESKDAGVEEVLLAYGNAIDAGNGGLLLSVVGGKMSEGINFSDRLGRCVVIVGLPFPNINSAEWKAKLEYIASSVTERLSNPESGHHESVASEQRTGITALSKQEIERRAKDASRDFYENACMRAVNQSVGRAIRHREDYAAIVMVDKRFASERVRGKLPGWIQSGLVEGAGEKSFGLLMGKLGAFFGGKRGS
jgi:chromosome transmission fidelity protein 1